jgi:hypothetical protein
MDEAEMRRRVKARAAAAFDRMMVRRELEAALARLPKDSGDELLCLLIVERCPEMFEDAELDQASKIQVVADPRLPLGEWKLVAQDGAVVDGGNVAEAGRRHDGAAMTRDEIIAKLLHEPTPYQRDTLVAHPAFDPFVAQMAQRQYGEGPLRSAWAFFASGWDAADTGAA